jgi:hypothetical protein
MSPQQRGPGTGTNATLPTGGQVGGRGALPFFGESIPKIAKELGIADKSLRRWIRQHEIPERERQRPTADER